MILFSQIILFPWVMGFFKAVQFHNSEGAQFLKQFLNHVLRLSTVPLKVLNSHLARSSSILLSIQARTLLQLLCTNSEGSGGRQGGAMGMVVMGSVLVIKTMVAWLTGVGTEQWTLSKAPLLPPAFSLLLLWLGWEQVGKAEVSYRMVSSEAAVTLLCGL